MSGDPDISKTVTSHVRPAVEADIPAILAIWNPIIRDTAITFTDAEKAAETLTATLAEKARAGHAFLVAETPDGIAGFATFGSFRNGSGYRQSFEHTVLLGPGQRGKGIGRALMAAIEEAARKAGGHMIFAGVSAENAEGIAFHKALGYAEVARLREVGLKFGRRLDLALMQKRL